VLHRLASPVDDADGDGEVLACGTGDHGVREVASPVEVGLLGGGRGGRHADARGRLIPPGSERRRPAGEVVAVLADVLLLERVGDEQVLGVGGPAVGQHHLGVEARWDERADGGARRRDAGHDAAIAADRHAAGAGERRLGRDQREAGRDRGGDHAEAVQVLGARDALGRGDPGLGAGPAHAAGTAVVHPGAGDQRAARTDHDDAPGEAELLGLLDRATDESAGRFQVQVLDPHAPTML
jgi:hypothetical protein